MAHGFSSLVVAGGSPRLDELPVPRLPKRETFANGAARFAGGGASGREDLHEDPRREISLPRSMDETSLPGDARDAVTYEFRKTFGDIKTRESPPPERVHSVGNGGHVSCHFGTFVSNQ